MVNKIRYCEDEKVGSSKPIFLLEFVDCVDIPNGLFHSGNLIDYILCQSNKFRNLNPNDFFLEYEGSKINVFVKRLESQEEYRNRLWENNTLLDNKKIILDILTAMHSESNWKKIERNCNSWGDVSVYEEDVLLINKRYKELSGDIINEINKNKVCEQSGCDISDDDNDCDQIHDIIVK